MERLIKLTSYYYPLTFCQLPNSKFISVDDKLVLPRIKHFLTELTIFLVTLGEARKLNDVTDLQFISYLFKQPQQLWGCVERF